MQQRAVIYLAGELKLVGKLEIPSDFIRIDCAEDCGPLVRVPGNENAERLEVIYAPREAFRFVGVLDPGPAYGAGARITAETAERVWAGGRELLEVR